MRPLVMDFNEDTFAVKEPYEYMFGKAFLVAPVFEPNVDQWNVYLPAFVDWYDFWSGNRFDGGQTINTDAPIDKIPLFVKAGSIVPMGPFIQYATEKSDPIEIRIYQGGDGEFVLYEDENDNYNYEEGNYSTIIFKWDDNNKTLIVGDRESSFPGMIEKRSFRIIKVSESKGIGINETIECDKEIDYYGKEIITKIQ